MGVHTIKKLNKRQVPKIAAWIHSNNTIEVNYPDTTEDILEALLIPYYNLPILPTILS